MTIIKKTSEGDCERIKFMRSAIEFSPELERSLENVKHFIGMFKMNPLAPVFNYENARDCTLKSEDGKRKIPRSVDQRFTVKPRFVSCYMTQTPKDIRELFETCFGNSYKKECRYWVSYIQNVRFFSPKIFLSYVYRMRS